MTDGWIHSTDNTRLADRVDLRLLKTGDLLELADRVDDELSSRIETRGGTPEPLIPVPDDDIEGFADWVEREYTDDRWSDYYWDGDSVSVWSGRHPAYQRFIADLRPRLHEHGLTIWSTRGRMPKKIDGEMEHVHLVTAVPIARVVAEHDGLICDRMVCGNLVEGTRDYCSSCGGVMEEDDG